MIRIHTVVGLILCAATATAQAPTSPGKGTKTVGGEFDPAFQEQAPAGGLLIGFEITLRKLVDREVVRSLRPIFRTSKDEEIKGKQYGVAEGKVYLAKAKAGYAVGAVKLHQGLLIDGMSVIFMKTGGSVLDRHDAYATAWIGNSTGGSPRTLTGDGIPIVGFAAKVTANRECSSLGLILKYAPPEPSVASTLARANYDRIQNGMTEKQVTAILSPPDSWSQRATKVLVWRQLDRSPDGALSVTVTVTLRAGRVAARNWQWINFLKQ